MSERTAYPAGVPCWVDTLQPDPDAATRFYAELFGWELAGPGVMPGTPPGKYFVGRLRGRDVAGISSMPAHGAPPTAVWNTYVSVVNAEQTCAKVRTAGGNIVVAPLDAPPAGRLAVLEDAAGAAVSIWEARDRVGAQILNEPGAWAMSTLFTRDLESSKNFYGDVFGWQPDTFAAGATEITLWRLPGYHGGEPQQPVPRDVVGVMVPMSDDVFPAGTSPHWSVDFWINDVDCAAAKAASLGSTVVVPPHDTPGFRRCILSDPQGAVLSLSQLTAFH